MSEQFGAIPVRAFGDTRLSAADFRILGAIAYFDRLGRNGVGCFADPRKLAEMAAVSYQHISRHTARLQEFGYVEIGRSATDRSKRVYSLIYNEDGAIVPDSGDNSAGTVSAHDANAEKDTNDGDDSAEKVTKPNSQAIEPKPRPRPKRSCKTDIKDPAKPRARGGANPPGAGGLNQPGDLKSHATTSKPTKDARQGDRGGGNSRAQGHMMLPIAGGYQKPRTQQQEPDWRGWAAWLSGGRPGENRSGEGTATGLTVEGVWNWLSDEIDRIATERGVGVSEAGVLLDRELKKRRKAAA